MFTGIVEAVGQVVAVDPGEVDTRIQIDANGLDLHDIKIGDSINVHGACLTVVELEGNGFAADISRATLGSTNHGDLRKDSRLNLEKALTLASRLCGHLVTGHVDSVGTVVKCIPEGRSIRFGIKVPDKLVRYISRKGSICVDGVSLTVNTVTGTQFEVQVIPHTLARTTFADYSIGQIVNVEVDIIARYVEQLLRADPEGFLCGRGITWERLARHGFTPAGRQP